MLLRLIPFFLVSVSAFSAGFTAQADCAVTAQGITVRDQGTLSCYAGPLFDSELGMYKSSSVSNTIFATEVGSGVNFFELTIDKRMQDHGRFAFFSSFIQYEQTFATAGPLRTGFIAYTLRPGPRCNACTEAFDYQEWNVGPYSGYSTGRNDGQFRGDGTFFLPIVLGDTFGVRMTANSFDAGDSGHVEGRSSLEFRLYEADGTTPVQIQNTPEPTTALLSALALSTLFLVSRNRP